MAGDPLRDSPTPLARPPPPRGSRGSGGGGSRERRTGDTGRTGWTGGRKWGWGREVTQARRSGCGRDRPGLRPQVCATLRLQLGGGRVPNLATLRKPRHDRPGLGDRLFPPRRSRKEFPRGRVLSRHIPWMPPGRGGQASLSIPARCQLPLREGRPQPTRAPSPRPGLATSPEPKSPAPWLPGARTEAAASISLSGSHPLRDSSSKTPIHSVPREPQRPTPCRPGCDTQ